MHATHLVWITSFQLAGLTVIGLTLWLRFDPAFEKGMRTNILRVDNDSAAMDKVKDQIRFAVRSFSINHRKKKKPPKKIK